MAGVEYVRVCGCGCQRELRDKHGEPDFERFFFSDECRGRDKTARVAQKRARKKHKETLRKTCPGCNRKKVRTWLTVYRPDGLRVKIGVMNPATARKIIAAAAMPPDAARTLPLAVIPIKKIRGKKPA